MKKCIYCLKSKEITFNGREHVMLQSFGRFGSNTPTLKCVCDNCNRYFRTHLDELFSRNTLEGITRYRRGIFSRESRFQQFLLITLPNTPKMGDWGGVVVWLDGKTGRVMPPIPQVHFKHLGEEKRSVIVKDSISKLDIKKKRYSTKDMKLFAPSEDEMNCLIRELKKIGIDYKPKGRFRPPFAKHTGEIEVTVRGRITFQMQRALVKMLFNLVAYSFGERELLKRRWDQARKFVRRDKTPLRLKVTTRPFWGNKSINSKVYDNCYNARIENIGNQVLGTIQFFNLFTYEFILLEDGNIPQEIAFMFIPGRQPIKGVKIGSKILARLYNMSNPWLPLIEDNPKEQEQSRVQQSPIL